MDVRRLVVEGHVRCARDRKLVFFFGGFMGGSGARGVLMMMMVVVEDVLWGR